MENRHHVLSCWQCCWCEGEPFVLDRRVVSLSKKWFQQFQLLYCSNSVVRCDFSYLKKKYAPDCWLLSHQIMFGWRLYLSSLESHKEERFLYPICPLICFLLQLSLRAVLLVMVLLWYPDSCFLEEACGIKDMTSNSQSSGTQSLWPPIVGSAGPQNFGLPMYMQICPVGSQQQGQPFTRPGSQQYLPVGQGMPAQNVGPSPQNQQLPFVYPSFIGHGHGPQPLSNHMHGVSGNGQFAPSTYGQPENYINASSHYQLISRMHTAATNVHPFIQLSLDWKEHTSCDGRRYYYNKKTKQSSWEKPVELMTLIERADASTNWKEFTNSDGRKYYYNKVTKKSTWIVPEELKVARKHADREASHEIQSEGDVVSQSQVSLTIPLPEASSVTSSAPSGRTTKHVPVTPIVAARSQPAVAASRSPSLPALFSGLSINAAGTQSPVATLSDSISGNGGVPAATTPAMSTSDITNALNGGGSVQDLEEARKGLAKLNITPLEEKAVEEETLVYSQEGNAVVGSTNMESDWNWELV